MKPDLKKLQDIIGYSFNDEQKLLTAVTHSSYVNEVMVGKTADNERMEFLGDAVLELVSSEYIFNRFTDKSEGVMSKIRAFAVCEDSLYEQALRLGMPEFVRLGTGTRKQGGAGLPSILSDALEAIIAAIFLDGGLEPAKKFVLEKVLSGVNMDMASVDPKSTIQQYFQGLKDHQTVKYRIISEEGPSNEKTFVVQAYVGEKLLETGTGSSIRAAEKEAAKRSLMKINRNVGK